MIKNIVNSSFRIVNRSRVRSYSTILGSGRDSGQAGEGKKGEDHQEHQKKSGGEESFFKNSSKLRPLIVGSAVLLSGAMAGALLLDEKPNDNECITQLKKLPGAKERIVILGSGWSALSFINNLDLSKFELVIISPRNYFLFTPMLTTATVGSVETRSIIEPIRRVLKRLKKNDAIFIEAECTDIDYQNDQVTIKNLVGDHVAAIPYDKLVVAIGSVPGSFGTKGVEENCIFIKEIQDATKIRDKIMSCFESANFPGLSEEEIKRRLNMVIVGGGPSGVELAGSVYEFFDDDLSAMFPKLTPHAKITLVQSADHLLNTFDARIVEYTEKLFLKSGIKTLINSRVVEVKKDSIVVLHKGDTKPYEIPMGMCVWATGVGPRTLTSKFCDSIPEQKNNRAISTDPSLKALGVPHNNVYAIGDCGTINRDILMGKLTKFFKSADKNNDNQLSKDELRALFQENMEEYPQMKPYLHGMEHFFKEFDTSGDGFLQFDEFKQLMIKIDNNLTTLPATAQVANQMGIYLARAFNEVKEKNLKPDQVKPFSYRHLGSFAYIGHQNAVADIPSAFSGGGFATYWLWNAVYLNNQFSWKNRFLVSMDQIKSFLFGRDVSRV